MENSQLLAVREQMLKIWRHLNVIHDDVLDIENQIIRTQDQYSNKLMTMIVTDLQCERSLLCTVATMSKLIRSQNRRDIDAE